METSADQANISALAAAVLSPQQSRVLSSSLDASHVCSPLLDKDEEKWPVSQKQNVIVVTRTHQEQKTKQRRKIAILVAILLFIIGWVVFLISYV